MKLDSVLGMHYFPTLNFNSKQEYVCSSLWVLHQHQDQYYSVRKLKAIVKSLTDLMEVVTFKKKKALFRIAFFITCFLKVR